MLNYLNGVMGYDNKLSTNRSIVKEEYYGKSKKMLDIEKQIGIARKKYFGRGIDSGFYDDKDIDKIGKMFASLFGFHYVDFNLANNVLPNAYTYPVGRGIISGSVVSTAYMRKTREGLKVRGSMSDLSLYIRVTTGLFYNEKYSDAEILAIILHEIGHNFQGRNAVLANYDLFIMMGSWIAMVSSGFASVPLYLSADATSRANVNAYAKSNPTWSSIVKACSGISGLISIINANINFLLELINPFAHYAYGVANKIIKQVASGDVLGILSRPFDKSAEYVSDDFANEMGYGPELASALSKMELSKDYNSLSKAMNSSKNPVVQFYNSYMDTCMIVATIILSPLSNHPSTGKRIKAMTDKLEDELKRSDLSPQLKKDIKAQISQMKDLGNTMENVDGSKAMKSFINFQMGRKKDPLSSFIVQRNETYISKENAITENDDLCSYM